MELKYRIIWLYIISVGLVIAEAIESVTNMYGFFVTIVMIILITVTAFYERKRDEN